MASGAVTLSEAVVPFLATLLPRHGIGNPGGKSNAQFATQGRFNYVPSFAAAIIFLVLYAFIVSANAFLLFRHRAWFWWSMNLAVSMELVGYVARAVSIKHLAEENIFIIQLVFILVAPAVMAAACYQAFGRIVLWVVPLEFQSARHLWLPARRITPLFVGCDIFSFFVQIVGGSMVAGANTVTRANTGKNVVLVGLAIQMATFGFFVLASIRFGVVLRTKLREVSLPTERNWHLFLRVINGASVLILFRTTARFIEFVLGTHNYLSDHEWYFYVFDALPMVLVGAIFVVFHPGNFLPYLGMRRRKMQFSNNADNGLFSHFAKGSDRVAVSPEDDFRTAEMSSRG